MARKRLCAHPHPPYKRLTARRSWQSNAACDDRESGSASKAKSYLPANKQYLITRNGALDVAFERSLTEH